MLLFGLVELPLWILLLLLLITIAVSYQMWKFSVYRAQGIPGPRPLPLFGTALPLFTQGTLKHDMGMMKYGKVVRGFNGSHPVLMISDENMLGDLFVKEFPSFTNRRFFRSGDENLDSMVAVIQDGHWKHVRSNMTPAFTTGKLRRMATEINRCANQLVRNLGEEADNGSDVDVRDIVGSFAMDVIASTAFGMRTDSQKEKNNVFVTKAKRAFTMSATSPLFIALILFPFLRPLLLALGVSFISRDASDFFIDVTKKALELRKAESDQSRTDFLQLMVNAQKGENIVDEEDKAEGVATTSQKGLTTPEILGNAFIFFVAGYETTSTSLGQLLYSLALEPDCQEKLYQEIQNVTGHMETIDYNLASRLPYLDQCISESLRLLPPAARLVRICGRDVTVKGIHIKKGTEIIVPTYCIHHDPNIWPEPEKFDPDRFAPEKKAKMSPFHWLPFGYGPRNCIGMRLALIELKIAACHVVRNYRVVPCEKTQIPLKLTGLNLLRPEKGFWLKFEKRGK